MVGVISAACRIIEECFMIRIDRRYRNSVKYRKRIDTVCTGVTFRTCETFSQSSGSSRRGFSSYPSWSALQQFLKAAYVLAQQDFGSTVAPIARAMWETWIDTAWLLLDARERAQLFWASMLPKTLALFANFEKYETLNEHNQQTKAILSRA